MGAANAQAIFQASLFCFFLILSTLTLYFIFFKKNHLFTFKLFTLLGLVEHNQNLAVHLWSVLLDKFEKCHLCNEEGVGVTRGFFLCVALSLW